MVDRGDLPRRLHGGEPGHDGRGEAGVGVEAAGLGGEVHIVGEPAGRYFALGAHLHVARVALGFPAAVLVGPLHGEALPFDVAFRLHPLSLGRAAHPRQLVGQVLVDEQLLLLGQLDLRVELVVLERALLLDGERAAAEGGLVGLLLDELAGGGLERPVHLGGGADRHHLHVHHAEAHGGDLGVLAQRVVDGVADGLGAAQHRGDLGVHDEAARRRLGLLRPQAREALQRLLQPQAGAQADGEVHAGGELLRVEAAGSWATAAESGRNQ